MGGTHNRIKSKVIGGVNSYHIYTQYGYHRSGIEGSTVSFKITLVLEWIHQAAERWSKYTRQYNIGVNTPGSRVLDLPQAFTT